MSDEQVGVGIRELKLREGIKTGRISQESM
jgi:hypothetical protein